MICLIRTSLIASMWPSTKARLTRLLWTANDPPTGVNDLLPLGGGQITEDTTITSADAVNILGNDFDLEGDLPNNCLHLKKPRSEGKNTGAQEFATSAWADL